MASNRDLLVAASTIWVVIAAILVMFMQAGFAFVEAGLTRDEAYRVVQRNAMQAWDEGRNFRTLLEADPEVSGQVSAEQLDTAFDLRRALVNIGRTFEALDELERQPLGPPTGP